MEKPLNEGELAQMISAYPDLAAVFEYARRTGQRGLLDHLARQARFLIMELQAEGVDVGEPGHGVTAADPEKSN